MIDEEIKHCPKCDTKMINVPLGRTEHQSFWRGIQVYSNFQFKCYRCGFLDEIVKVYHNR